MTRPKVLDIPDLARRGGLSSHTSTYRMAENALGPYLEASAASTSTVNHHVVEGLIKEVENARGYVQLHKGATSDLMADSFRNIGIMSATWIQREIINNSTQANHREAALAIYATHERQDPRLLLWPPIALTWGERINGYRNECQWTIDVLAHKVGIDRGCVIAHIHDKAKPRVDARHAYLSLFEKELKRPCPDLLEP